MLRTKRGRAGLVAIFFAIGLTTPLFSQPANDLCVDAVPIMLGDTAFDTVGATTDGIILDPAVCDPGAFGDDQIYNDIWFTFIAVADGLHTLTTCDQADYDTRLAVYDQAACPDDPTLVIGCNDDGAGCGLFTSEMEFDAVAGSSYLIRVGGFDAAAAGTGTLTLTSTPQVENVQCFDQGFGSGLADITWDAGLFDEIIIEVDGVVETTLPGTDISYTTIANPGPFPVTIEVCVIGVVGGVPAVGTCCTVELLDVPLANDDCGFPETILVGDTAFDTNAATTDGADLAGLCDPGPFGDDQIYNDIWYLFSATADGVWTASTCGQADFDTRLAVYEGTDCAISPVIACNDDGPGCPAFSAEVEFTAISGQDYLIRVGGFDDAARGTGTLSILEPPSVATPTGLLCTDAGFGLVDMSWTNAGTYDDINVYVDGALEATIPGTSSSYQTAPFTLPAFPEICIEGVVGADVSPQACCTVILNPPCPPNPDEIVTQSTDPTTITPLNSVSCNAAGVGHADNSYFRSYTLGQDRTITGVEFGIEAANSGANFTSQPVTVRIYDDPTPPLPAPVADLVLLAEVSVEIEDTATELFCVGIDPPVDAASGQTIVLEVFTPNGQADGHFFFIGSNAGGQSGDSYLAAAACGLVEPDTTATIGFPDMMIILNMLDGGDLGTPEDCTNGIDDDGDTLVDCADPDCASDPACGTGNFVRGDANQDGTVDISDGVFELAALFIPGSPSPDCSDSADCNDDGTFDISDPVYLLAALFIPMSPTLPDPSACGVDPTADPLDCASFIPCP